MDRERAVATGNEQGKLGRPRKALDVKLVEKLARQHLTLEQIAAVCEVSLSTLKDRIANEPEFSAAIKRGRASGIVLATGKLMAAIKRGHIPSVMFFLKTQCGWRESAPKESPEDEEAINSQLEVLLARFSSRGGGCTPPPAPPPPGDSRAARE